MLYMIFIGPFFLFPFDSVDDVTDMFQECAIHFYNFFQFRTIRVRSHEPLWMKISLKLLINEHDQAFSPGVVKNFREKIS